MARTQSGCAVKALDCCAGAGEPAEDAAEANKHGAARVTVDQLRALQAFPEGFTFTGTLTEQHRQVGNAVPPPLAEAVGRSVLAAIGGVQ